MFSKYCALRMTGCTVQACGRGVERFAWEVGVSVCSQYERDESSRAS